ncbi:uncharacterized protein [Fopius arisanus]|uniref:Uncharacterized protein n=1 Tax=Fopius arisanus TaxID=64838 RepID=A0A9R1TKI3_9HYME|nr:PREDICTED: uncharacterized protein LOC105271339 [Fopius arisanus]
MLYLINIIIISALAVLTPCSAEEPCRSCPCIIVNVYYTALDPESRSAFRTQLVPGYSEFRNNLIMNLLPFGNRKVQLDELNPNQIICQKGRPECREGVAHACAMAVIHEEETPLETKHYLSMKVIGCAMSSDSPGMIQQYDSIKTEQIAPSDLKKSICDRFSDEEKPITCLR